MQEPHRTLRGKEEVNWTPGEQRGGTRTVLVSNGSRPPFFPSRLMATRPLQGTPHRVRRKELLHPFLALAWPTFRRRRQLPHRVYHPCYFTCPASAQGP